MIAIGGTDHYKIAQYVCTAAAKNFGWLDSRNSASDKPHQRYGGAQRFEAIEGGALGLVLKTEFADAQSLR